MLLLRSAVVLEVEGVLVGDVPAAPMGVAMLGLGRWADPCRKQ